MRKLRKAIRFTLLGLFVLAVVLFAAGLALRATRQHENARRFAIRTANGIAEAMYVKIGGIDQWIQIRGRERDNPVLLCLHGGPGGSWLGYTKLFLPWEGQFTVVQWDQRGAGKTLETTGPSIADTMSVERMSQDAIEVAEFLRGHLHKDKIVLLGFSWGSLLGVHAVKGRPDLFYAYVGTGQISNMVESQRLSYAYALDKAKAANDRKSVAKLESIGPPPFDNMPKIATFFHILGNYECASDQNDPGGAFTSPDLSLRDIYYMIQGFARVPTIRVYREMFSADLVSLGPDFQVPVFFFQGTEDERSQFALAKKYFDAINAPHKEFVPLEGAGHFAVLAMPDRFLTELVTRVRSLATSPPANAAN